MGLISIPSPWAALLLPPGPFLMMFPTSSSTDDPCLKFLPVEAAESCRKSGWGRCAWYWMYSINSSFLPWRSFLGVNSFCKKYYDNMIIYIFFEKWKKWKKLFLFTNWKQQQQKVLSNYLAHKYLHMIWNLNFDYSFVHFQ